APRAVSGATTSRTTRARLAAAITTTADDGGTARRADAVPIDTAWWPRAAPTHVPRVHARRARARPPAPSPPPHQRAAQPGSRAPHPCAAAPYAMPATRLRVDGTVPVKPRSVLSGPWRLRSYRYQLQL